MPSSITVPLNKPKPTREFAPHVRADMEVRMLEQGVLDPEHVRDVIRTEESVRYRVYKDKLNHPTVGIGFNMKRKDARDKFKAIGADYDAVRYKNRPLTQNQVEHLFNLSLIDAYTDVRKAVPNFDSLPASRQAALVDMSFNLGTNKFSGPNGFTRMLNGVKTLDWDKAARNIKNSAYAKQLPERAARNINRMLMPMSEFTPPRRGRQ